MTRPDDHNARLDAWGMPICDGTHPQCCARADEYRARKAARPRQSKEARK